MTTTTAIQDGFITMASGRRFWPLAPREVDVDVEDIAHNLAHLCRWGGGTREFYSVAQHSLHVLELLPQVIRVFGGELTREIELAALLHDAAEAYMGADLPRPIKRRLWAFKRAEEEILHVVYRAFGLPVSLTDLDLIHRADYQLMLVEARDITRAGQYHEPPAVDYEIASCWPPWVAREAFATKLLGLLDRSPELAADV